MRDPSPAAILRFQRLRDNGMTVVDGCTAGVKAYSASVAGNDFWPLTLFDAREGWSRPIGQAAVPALPAAGMHTGGLMGYVAFDANNFRRWITNTNGVAGGTGALTRNNNGFIIYFSDRRGDHNDELRRCRNRRVW